MRANASSCNCQSFPVRAAGGVGLGGVSVAGAGGTFWPRQFSGDRRQALFSDAWAACLLLVFAGGESAAARRVVRPAGRRRRSARCCKSSRLGGGFSGGQSRAVGSRVAKLAAFAPLVWRQGPHHQERQPPRSHPHSDWRSEKVFLLFLQVEYVQTESEIYVVPLACALGEKADPICHDWPPLVLARLSVKNTHEDGVLYDAIANKAFCRALLEMISSRRVMPGRHGELDRHAHGRAAADAPRQAVCDLDPAVSKAEQSNSSVIYGDRLILKFFRKLDQGVNPELEIGRFLMDRRFPFSPPLAGALEYRSHSGEPMTVGGSHFVCAGMQGRLGIHLGHPEPVLRAHPNAALGKQSGARRCPRPPWWNWRRRNCPRRPPN